MAVEKDTPPNYKALAEKLAWDITEVAFRVNAARLEMIATSEKYKGGDEAFLGVDYVLCGVRERLDQLAAHIDGTAHG